MHVYDFLLYSMTHASRKNTENRPEDPKLWPLECLNKGSVYAHSSRFVYGRNVRSEMTCDFAKAQAVHQLGPRLG
jgi:hypothetical protein